ncbi:MAG: pentapeptide repeat-containing protein, partial [Myxococcota bacterium]
ADVGATRLGEVGAYISFSQAKLRDVDASAAKWPDVDLAEAKLHQAKLVEADLHNADLTGASGAEADFSGANLDNSVGTEARFPGGRFVGTRLGQARWVRANLANADLSGADLSAADFSEANLSGANLSGANLSGAVLADANLSGANLEGADFTAADLSGLEPLDLGLSAEVAETLVASGVPWNPDAPWTYRSLSVARRGDRVAITWVNLDGEEHRSARWAILKGEDVVAMGVVPVPAASLVDLAVVPTGESTEAGDFLVVVVRDRTEGTVLKTYPLVSGADGEPAGLRPPRTGPLGYRLIARPIVQGGPKPRMLGLAERGPTLIVHDLTADPPEPIGSSTIKTAQRFLPGHPVVWCKSGVVMQVDGARPGPPRSLPEGFSERGGVVAPVDTREGLQAVWVEPRVRNLPGGVRTAAVGPRHAPEPTVLGTLAGVIALDTAPEDGGLRVVWAEAGDEGDGPALVKTARLPDGEPGFLDIPDDVVTIQVSARVAAFVMLSGELRCVDPATGDVLASVG